MVWVIPLDTEQNMANQLACLMVNMETNKTVFDKNQKFIGSNDPFNVYENDYFIDTYTFVRGYIKTTGGLLKSNLVYELAKKIRPYVDYDSPCDVDYCHITSNYTVVKMHDELEYSNDVITDNIKNSKRRNTNFLWYLGKYEVADMLEIRNSASFPESYELMKSLSLIIFDNAGLIAKDYNGNPTESGTLFYNINYPEFWQFKNSDKIVDIPIKFHKTYGVRYDVKKKFESLIPALSKFNINHNPIKDLEKVHTYVKEVSEARIISELNLPEIDTKESISRKIHDPQSFRLMKIGLNESNKYDVPFDIIRKYFSCHNCFTPLYDKFYYVMPNVDDNEPVPHIPICALCYHMYSNCHIVDYRKVGISTSPYTLSDILSKLIPSATISQLQYERYKRLMQHLFDNRILINIDDDVILRLDGIKLISNINNRTLLNGIDSADASNDSIFVVELI
jgi:hypothetical protein